MSKSVNTLLGAIVGFGALAAAASGAQAHHWSHGCTGCGPQPTRYSYHDVYTHSDVYHHHNVTHSYPVYIPQQNISITRIHPSVTVHNIVTIHHQPYPVVVEHYKSETVTEGTTYKTETVTHTVQEPCRCYKPSCH